MESRLAGWKSQCLSMAGRVTLAQSFLGSMASFMMQHARVPASICEEMEMMQRDFVWCSSNGNRKPRLLNWDRLCLPKHYSGLGFKKMKYVNDVFLIKLAWGILSKEHYKKRCI